MGPDDMNAVQSVLRVLSGHWNESMVWSDFLVNTETVSGATTQDVPAERQPEELLLGPVSANRLLWPATSALQRPI
jgi:hypothetical protein